MKKLKKVKFLYLESCGYCRNAQKAIDELKSRNPEYESIEIEKIEESLHPEIARQFDYWYVPTFFVDGEKIFEARPGMGYEEILTEVKKVLEAAQ